MTIAEQFAEIAERTSEELQHFADLKRADEHMTILDCATLIAIIIGDRAVLREIAPDHAWGGGPTAEELADKARKRLAE